MSWLPLPGDRGGAQWQRATRAVMPQRLLSRVWILLPALPPREKPPDAQTRCPWASLLPRACRGQAPAGLLYPAVPQALSWHQQLQPWHLPPRAPQPTGPRVCSTQLPLRPGPSIVSHGVQGSAWEQQLPLHTKVTAAPSVAVGVGAFGLHPALPAGLPRAVRSFPSAPLHSAPFHFPSDSSSAFCNHGAVGEGVEGPQPGATRPQQHPRLSRVARLHPRQSGGPACPQQARGFFLNAQAAVLGAVPRLAPAGELVSPHTAALALGALRPGSRHGPPRACPPDLARPHRQPLQQAWGRGGTSQPAPQSLPWLTQRPASGPARWGLMGLGGPSDPVPGAVEAATGSRCWARQGSLLPHALHRGFPCQRLLPPQLCLPGLDELLRPQLLEPVAGGFAGHKNRAQESPGDRDRPASSGDLGPWLHTDHGAGEQLQPPLLRSPWSQGRWKKRCWCELRLSPARTVEPGALQQRAGRSCSVERHVQRHACSMRPPCSEMLQQPCSPACKRLQGVPAPRGALPTPGEAMGTDAAVGARTGRRPKPAQNPGHDRLGPGAGGHG